MMRNSNRSILQKIDQHSSTLPVDVIIINNNAPVRSTADRIIGIIVIIVNIITTVKHHPTLQHVGIG